MPGYIIYIDALILRLFSNFLFEFILLWAAAEVTRSPTTRPRLALGALIGTLHYLLFMLSSYSLIPFYGLLRFFPTLVLISLLMIVVCFYPCTKGRKLFRVLAYFYGIGFISAGAGMAAAYLLGSAAEPQFTAGVLVSIAVILIAAELGWGVIQKRIYHHVYQLPIKIVFNERSVELTALIDTGNQLKEPLTKQPVIVVEQNALMPLFDEETAQLIADLSSGNLSAIDHAEPDVAVRLRIIPFNAIGVKNGVLVGFRPDRIEITNSSEQCDTSGIIAVYQHTLDPDGEYQALLPPELLDSPVPAAASPITFQGGEPTHAAQSEREA